MNGQEGYSYRGTGETTSFINIKIKDLEEKQRILKDRLVLIGENLIETKEEIEEKILEIKKELETIKEKIDRIISFMEITSNEFSKFAKKEDLEILAKQAKMFQPLEFLRKDLETIKK